MGRESPGGGSRSPANEDKDPLEDNPQALNPWTLGSRDPRPTSLLSGLTTFHHTLQNPTASQSIPITRQHSWSAVIFHRFPYPHWSKNLTISNRIPLARQKRDCKSLPLVHLTALMLLLTHFITKFFRLRRKVTPECQMQINPILQPLVLQ
ncbi:MAG: hypothetical protein M2R45_01231 [Verrucomicrobia subdivision 3 bacterium]|nr:hypothetical protein [Limisphaerales bacterium]MCS1415217.1 hypothetical protein [Limisphaerales bacterium]